MVNPPFRAMFRLLTQKLISELKPKATLIGLVEKEALRTPLAISAYNPLTKQTSIVFVGNFLEASKKLWW
ncbi:hypothetical protein V6N12_002624 [Hibiscus sabdariffa]|uniref:Uncharacterized protein n=1 Tax=Hibiscus sabdariffa TaxID=183260 RepID=A0ABR2E9Z6_9ROSI